MTWPSLRVENEHFKINSGDSHAHLKVNLIVQVFDGVFLFFSVGRGFWSLWGYSGVSQAVSWESQKFRVKASATMRFICNWKVARALINLGHLSGLPFRWCSSFHKGWNLWRQLALDSEGIWKLCLARHPDVWWDQTEDRGSISPSSSGPCLLSTG